MSHYEIITVENSSPKWWRNLVGSFIKIGSILGWGGSRGTVWTWTHRNSFALLISGGSWPECPDMTPTKWLSVSNHKESNCTELLPPTLFNAMWLKAIHELHHTPIRQLSARIIRTYSASLLLIWMNSYNQSCLSSSCAHLHHNIVLCRMSWKRSPPKLKFSINTQMSLQGNFD